MRRYRRKPAILLVDDDPLFRAIVARVLRDIGTVTQACDGHDAYQTARNDRPDLVILDLNMPRWDGVQTIRAFQSDPALRAVPIVITSGSIDSDLFYAACSVGVSGFAAKADIQEDSFLKLIQKSLYDIRLKTSVSAEI